MYSERSSQPTHTQVTTSLKALLKSKQLKMQKTVSDYPSSSGKNFNQSLKVEKQQWNKKTISSNSYFQKRNCGSQGRISYTDGKTWSKVPEFLRDDRNQQIMSKMGMGNDKKNPQKKVFFGQQTNKVSDQENKRKKRTSMPNVPHFYEKASEETNDSPKAPAQNSPQVEPSNFMKKKSQTDEKTLPSFSKSFQKINYKKQLFSPLRLKTSRESKKISLNDFDSIKNLGSGKYGKVFLARHKETNFIGAIKIVEKKLIMEENIVEQFIRELKIQNFLNHPNVVRLYGFFDDEVNIYVLMEACMDGELLKKLKRDLNMSEKKAALIMKQVCSAINQLHSNQILHRDIKPENIVLHQNVIKICDFGWSTFRENKLRSTFCGTPLYVCPEILRGSQYDQKIDVWSLGIMAYEILLGQNPFNILKQEDLMKIVKDDIFYPTNDSISEGAKDFLEKCLQKNPLNRWTVRQLLNHPFIKDVEEKKLKL